MGNFRVTSEVPFVFYCDSTKFGSSVLNITPVQSIINNIIIFITFAHDIYNYIPETSHVSGVHSVATVLLLQFVLRVTRPKLNVLYLYTGTLRSTCAVPNMTVFCCSLTPCYPVTLFRCFLDDLGVFLVDPVFTGITLLLHSTYTPLLLSGPHILECSHLFS